jgi:acyl-CoA thioesterase
MTSLTHIIDDFNPSSNFDTPANWLQGRTIYGGLSVALALQAALRDGPAALLPLKSAQIVFVGPASTALTFKTSMLRQGKSTTCISVDCMSAAGVALRVLFIFADPRPSKIQQDFNQFPAVKGPESYQRPGVVAQAPASLSNFELRFAGKSLPVSGSDHPQLMAWVRHLDASGVNPTVALLALGDSLPLAVMASFTEFAPISSTTWTLDMAQPVTAGEWFLLRSTSRRASDGYSFQTMESGTSRGNWFSQARRLWPFLFIETSIIHDITTM